MLLTKKNSVKFEFSIDGIKKFNKSGAACITKIKTNVIKKMSRVTKLKHVKRELETDDFSLPTETQQIVKIVSSKGNNLHEAEPADSTETFLVSMPNKVN